MIVLTSRLMMREPYWVCPVKKFNIGLFGGQTVGRVVLCNALRRNDRL
ncbi:MAG: hypothetical protein ACLT33_08760 [Lachnospira pectinoschiza]